MPLATLLMAPALLATAALVAWCLRLVAPAAGRPVTSAAAWAALVLGPATWFAGSGAPRELAAPFPVAGVPLILRLDAVTVLAWTALLVPVALLLTFQRRTAAQAAIAALTASAGLFTLAAGSLVLAAFGLATCAGLVLVLFRQEEPAPIQSYWTAVTAAWLLMAWAAVLLQVTGGTSAYSAVPVTALREPPLALLAAAALLCSGVLPCVRGCRRRGPAVG